MESPVYIGKISHKGKIYEGLHDGIIDPEVWQRVQQNLKDNTHARSEVTQQRHILQGLIHDPASTVYRSSFTKRHGRQYRYYLSQNLLQYKDHPHGILARLPVHEIETFVEKALYQEIPNFCQETEGKARDHILSQEAIIPGYGLIRGCIDRVTIDLTETILKIKPQTFKKRVHKYLNVSLTEVAEPYDVTVPFKLRKAQRGALVIEPEGGDKDIFDLPPSSLKKLVQGTIWREDHFNGTSLKNIAKREDCSKAYVGTAIYQSLDFGA